MSSFLTPVLPVHMNSPLVTILGHFPRPFFLITHFCKIIFSHFSFRLFDFQMTVSNEISPQKFGMHWMCIHAHRKYLYFIILIRVRGLKASKIIMDITTYSRLLVLRLHRLTSCTIVAEKLPHNHGVAMTYRWISVPTLQLAYLILLMLNSLLIWSMFCGNATV
jgi:hypothetical protein